MIQGTSRWSHNVFSDLALKLTHHLFHSILLLAWVSSRQCGRWLHRAMPSIRSRLLWATLEALTTQGLYIYQQTVIFSVCQRVFKSLLYLQLSLLLSWNCCCAIFVSGSICQRLVYFKEAALDFSFFKVSSVWLFYMYYLSYYFIFSPSTSFRFALDYL